MQKALEIIKSWSPGKKLILNTLSLTELPVIPYGVTDIELKENFLTNIDTLPNSILHINIDNNNIVEINKLPNKLISLDCSRNKIKKLPNFLPTTLEKITCKNNQLTSINLLNLNNLTELKVDNNQIEDLSTIPKNLKTLYISNNKLKYLSRLPFQLKHLHCSNNELETLDIPKSLRDLQCSSNNLTNLFIPHNSNLQILQCKKNNFNDISINLIECKQLRELNISHNKFILLPVINYQNIVELNISYTEIKNLDKISMMYNLTKLKCSGLNLSKLNFKFNKLTELVCKKNVLTSFKVLPQSLIYLDASYNTLTILPEIKNSNLKFLRLNNNKLTFIPELPKNLMFLSYHDNILDEDLIPCKFKSYSKGDISEVIEYNGVKINIMVLPKGTILYRGIKKSQYPNTDFLGVFRDNPLTDEVGEYRLYPNYNVFFYPYPYVVDSVVFDITDILIYELTRDVKIIMGVYPSKNVRNDRNKGEYFINCDKVKLSEDKDIVGRYYDPCMKDSFIESHPDILGFIGIAKSDGKKIMKNTIKHPEFNDYFILSEDNEGNIGVPEIALYPKTVRKLEEIITPISKLKGDGLDYINQHQKEFNFKLINTFNHKNFKIDKFKDYLDEN